MDSRLRFQQLASAPPPTQLGDGIRRSDGRDHDRLVDEYAAADDGGCADAQAKASRQQVTLSDRKHAIHPRGKSERQRTAESAGGGVQERVESKMLSS